MPDRLILFWEDLAFSYKHGCLIPSTLSLMCFYRLVIDEALVSRLVLHLLDNSSHFSWAIVCSAAPELSFSTLVTKTERYWCWTDWVFFLEAMRSATNMVVWSLQLCHWCFFYRFVFDRAVVFRVVLHLVDFFGALNMCRSPRLRIFTLVTKTAILMLDWWGVLLRRPCVQLQTWSFDPFNFVIDVFLQVSLEGSCCFPGRFASRWHLVDFFGAIIMCSSAPQQMLYIGY